MANNVERTHEPDFLFKYILVGDSGVGKTCLMTQVTHSAFIPNHQSTIGVDYGTRILHIDGYPTTKVMIWDTAGQEVFKSIVLSYFKGAIGAILVYDITRRDTFEHIMEWLNDTQKHCNPDCVLMLVGNKRDLSVERQVEGKDAENFAKLNNLLFIETSAQTAYNVDEAFAQLSTEIYDRAQDGRINMSQCVPGIIRVEDAENQQNSSRKKKCCK